MRKYHLIVLNGDNHHYHEVEAEGFHSTTSSSASSGYYSFYVRSQLVACYPISRTIISKIENI